MISTDVLVIGAGAAGIRAAVAARESQANVVLVAADDVACGGSTFSRISNGWGIQALVGQERTAANLEAFYNDIIRVGLGMSDAKLVEILVEESGSAVEDLMSYGLEFKKLPGGEHIRATGCFSEFKRAYLTNDLDNVRQTFLSVLKRFAVKIVKGYTTDLILDAGTCRGARIMLPSNECLYVGSKSTILATGGGSGIFGDNMGRGNGEGMGDGYALAHLAGADLKNMEFIQFALGMKRNGDRKFLPIGQLDATHKIMDSAGGDILERFLPNDNQRCESLKARKKHMPFSCRDSSGLVDIAVAKAVRSYKKVYWKDNCGDQQQWQVAHLAHAFNGGVRINEKGESTVPGLYAAGEIAAGPHGADRIGGMMTATQVFGKRAGQFAAQNAKRSTHRVPRAVGREGRDCRSQRIIGEPDRQALAAIESRVKDAMGTYAGILRSKKGLKKCKKILAACADLLRAMEILGLSNFKCYYRVRNMIVTANLVVEAALAREISLGAHYREDCGKSL